MRTDWWTDMTKLIIVFRNFAKAAKTKGKSQVAFCTSLRNIWKWRQSSVYFLLDTTYMWVVKITPRPLYIAPLGNNFVRINSHHTNAAMASLRQLCQYLSGLKYWVMAGVSEEGDKFWAQNRGYLCSH